ncbi:MAG: transcription antitermination factor NusB [Candidatus Symbiothrix sp.]|nr:transcription antitermination factor NusB [Candidatus Symbiothrix sp.]
MLQIVYSYYQKGDLDVRGAQKELLRSLQKLYDLYHYLLLLITVLTDMEQKRADAQLHRYLSVGEKVFDSERFINNRFAEQLRQNEALQHFANKNGYLWDDGDQVFLRNLSFKILESPIYKEYSKGPDTYEADRNFWRRVLDKIVNTDEEIDDVLEEKCIYWNSDWAIVLTFVEKTIRRFEESTPVTQPLLPMFAQEDDKLFAMDLVRFAIQGKESSDVLIEEYIQNWDIERLSTLDLCVMELGVAEIRNFPSIPIVVSLNEYVELARYYSTPKSFQFINGILDAIAIKLKADGQLFKN